jgi:hypothetical protein
MLHGASDGIAIGLLMGCLPHAINRLVRLSVVRDTKHFHKHLPSYLSPPPDIDHMQGACLTVTHNAVRVKNGTRNTKLTCQKQG